MHVVQCFIDGLNGHSVIRSLRENNVGDSGAEVLAAAAGTMPVVVGSVKDLDVETAG